MAIKTSDYEPVKISGQEVPGLKRHKSEKDRFLIVIKKDGRKYRKIYRAPKDTPANMAKLARNELEKYRKSVGNTPTELDLGIRVDQYWERYVKLKANDWSQNHRRTMESYYRNHVKPYIGGKQVRRVTEADIEDIVNRLAHISKRSQKMVVEVLSPLFKRAVKERLIDESPVRVEVKRNMAQEKKVILSADEKLKNLYHAILELFADNPKVKAAFLLGLSGRRLGEVLTLKWSDVDLESGTYIVRKENSKVKTDMTFALSDELIRTLQELHECRDSEWVFSSNRDPKKRMVRLTQFYREVGEKAGIEGFHFHMMRNVLVSALAGRGVDVADLSALLGHTDTATLKKYLSLQREQASRKAINAMAGLLQ